VKLLFDENLSRKLVLRLADLYPDSAHVQDFGLCERSDTEIWDHAKQAGFTIVTTDSDFFEFATTLGPPPKVVWLRKWRRPTIDAEAVLRREALRVEEFGSDPLAAVLVLERHE
jgi:predicted nuclease of predicted toxin-antitoxin system